MTPCCMSYLLTNGIPVKKGEKRHNSLAAIALRELGVDVDKTLQSQDWMNADAVGSRHAICHG